MKLRFSLAALALSSVGDAAQNIHAETNHEFPVKNGCRTFGTSTDSTVGSWRAIAGQFHPWSRLAKTGARNRIGPVTRLAPSSIPIERPVFSTTAAARQENHPRPTGLGDRGGVSCGKRKGHP